MIHGRQSSSFKFGIRLCLAWDLLKGVVFIVIVVVVIVAFSVRLKLW